MCVKSDRSKRLIKSIQIQKLKLKLKCILYCQKILLSILRTLPLYVQCTIYSLTCYHYIYYCVKRDRFKKSRERKRENMFCEIKIIEVGIGNLFFRYYSSKCKNFSSVAFPSVGVDFMHLVLQ